MTTRTNCPRCEMPFDVPDSADRCWCDCGESWVVDHQKDTERSES